MRGYPIQIPQWMDADPCRLTYALLRFAPITSLNEVGETVSIVCIGLVFL